MVSILHNSFNQGELGPYMDGRADLPIYSRSAIKLLNWMVLPQGGLLRCPAYEFIHKLTDITDGDDARLMRFNVNEDQQYVLVMTEDQTLIFRDKSLVSTIVTPWQTEDLRALRAAQTGDTMIVCQEDTPTQELKRLDATELNWSVGEINIDPYPFFRHNLDHFATPSGTSGSITITLSESTEGYWNAGHTGILFKANDAANGAATLNDHVTKTTGGTALSSAGTAANAFDANFTTDCLAGVDGWIGYDFTVGIRVGVVGIRTINTRTFDLVFETDDNPTFTSPTVVGSVTMDASMPPSIYKYFDVPRHTPADHFRVREIGGETLDVEEVIFSDGLGINATTTTNFTGTSALEAWSEQAWGTAHGYPRTAVFLGNRLVFGGSRDEPKTVWFSKDGDLFNFDDTAVNDDNAFARTMSTDQNHFIRSMKTDRDGIVVFTSDGNFVIDGGAVALTPTNAAVKAQSNEGISNVDITEIDSDIIYGVSNGKQIKSKKYQFADDKYIAGTLTTLAHHLFKDGQVPRALSALRSFKDTQANMLWVPRSDGTMAVLTIDSAQSVLGWWTRNTPSSGKILDSVVVNTAHVVGGTPIETLYSIVQRTINGVQAVYLESITEESIYLDHWYVGNSVNFRVAGIPVIAGGGTGYSVDDVLTVVGGTSSTAATLTVSSVNSGVIDGITVSEVGDYTVLALNDVSVTGGGGSSATFTVTYEQIPKTSWTGATTLASSTVQGTGDGLFIGDIAIDGSGNFTLAEAVTQVYVGFHYDSEGEILVPGVEGDQIVKGKVIRLIEAVVDVYEASQLTINDYPVTFRQLGDDLLDEPLPQFTGQKSISISNKGGGRTDKDPTVKFKVQEPVSCGLLTLAVKTR